MKNRGDTCCESSKMLFTKSNAVIKGARILSLIFTAFLFSVSYTVNCQNAIQGIAPVLYPPGGFGVDGDALANYVQPGLYANSGDWFSDTAYIGKGGTVFNMSTADPYDLNYPMAHHWLDGWMHGTDLTVFTLSDKINDNPNSYTWADGSAPNKNEINNATVQFSWGDPTLPGGNATDLWCSFAADRQVNTGSAYIDFEFLQKPLTMTGTSSGGFLSSGTDSGRTVGDILITIEFQQGGAAAFAVIQRWQPKTGGGFEYAEFTPDAGDIFCTSNLEVQIAPWEPYGQFQYDINQYAEGAVNLTKVFNIAQNPCMVLSTVFVRTRTSGSSGHSELKDFPGAPYQINLDMDDLAITCPQAVNLTACTSQADVTTAYDTWKSGFSYTGGIAPVTTNIANFPALPGNFACTGGTLSFSYIVSDFCEKTDTCTSTFDVTQPAALVINCPALANLSGCTSQTAIDTAYDAWVAGFTFSGDCNATSNIASIPALPANAHCNGASISFTFTASGDCDSDTCSSTFDVAQPAALVINCPAPVNLVGCTSQTAIQDAYDDWVAGFTFSGDCNATSNIASIPALPANAHCNGASLSFTFTASGDCDSDTCSSTFDVAQPAALAINCPAPVNLVGCTSQTAIQDAYDDWVAGFTFSGDCNATSNIASIPALPANAHCNGASISFTFTASGDCDSDTCSSTFDVAQPAALVVNCPAPVNLVGCTSQTAIQDAYDDWVAGFTFSGDCNATSNIASIPALPANAHCNGASLSFTFTASGDCDSDTCSSTFDVAQPAALVVNCPAPVNLVGCTSQTAIQDAYDDWVAGFTFSGDCNATSNIASIPALPANAHCNGASLSFTFTASGDCDSDTCSSTFDVAQPAALVVNCPDSVSLPCIPLANILVAYDNWKAGFTFSGDCNVTDNMADFPPMDIDPILGGTLSFTYNVKGDCDQIECTSEFTVAPCGGHIFPTQTSCCNYLTGTPELENVCYKPDVGMVGNAIPGVFFYYTKIIAPSEAFTINVVQTKDCSNFNYFAVHQGNQILLFNDDCERLITVIPSESSTGQAHLVVNGATAGATYVLSVKYNVKSIIGSTYTGQPPTCDYHFVTNIGGIDITNSGGHINVVPGCSDNTPLPEECSLLPFNPASTITPLNEETMLNIYPNPFSNSAEITFASDNNETKVVLEVYDLLGNKVMKLYEGPTSADQPYTIAFNAGNNLGEGIYVLVLRTIHDVKTTRFVVNR